MHQPLHPRLTFVFTPAPESDGGGYTVHIEELPGVLSEGQTLDEAWDNVRDAMALMAVAKTTAQR